MSRIPHFLDNRIADDGEVVSLKRRPLFTSEKIKVVMMIMMMMMILAINELDI
jgi:hypothetical protein